MQSTIIDILSSYNNSGTDQATQAINNVGSAMDSASNKAEGLYKRLERPLGVIAFSSIADSLTDMGDKGEGATQMLEHGLHAAGAAISYFNPLVGLAVVGAGTLFAVMEKLGKSAEFNAEQTVKNAAAYAAQSDAAKKAAENLKGIIPEDQIEKLRALSTANEAEYKSTIASTSALLKKAEASKEVYDRIEAQLKAGQALSDQDAALVRREGSKLAEDKKNAEATIEALSAIGAARDKEKNLEIVDADKIAEAREKLATKFMTAANLQKEIVTRNIQISQLEAEAAKVTTKSQQDSIQARIDALQKLNQIDKQSADQQIENQNKLNETYAKQAREVEKYQNYISNAFTVSQGQIKVNLGKFADDVIKQTAQMLAQQLTLQAMKDFANPATIPIAVVELAAATAISAAGGIGGAAANAALSPSDSGSVGAGSSQNSQVQPGASLTINVQGDVLGDDAYMSKLATKLNQAILNNNVQLSATNVVVGGASNAPASTGYY